MSFGKGKSARDCYLTVVLRFLWFADTTHGNQRKTSLTRVSSSRFNTGEKDVDFGRGRAASSSAVTIYGHGRRGAPVTLSLIHPHPFPTALSPGGKGWGCVSENP